MNRLKSIAAFLLMLHYQSSFSQIPEKEFDKCYGGSSEEFLFVVYQAADGGFVFGGHSNSPVSGDKTQPSQGGYDYWVVKTDVNGIKQWDARYGGSGDEYLFSLVQTTDGGFLLGGKSNSNAGGDKSQNSNGDNDFWIVKTNVNGIKQWDATFGGDNNDALYSLQQTEDGGYILGGQSNSGISGDQTNSSRGNFDFWIIKTDENGVKQWDRRFGGTNADNLEALEQTEDGGFILGGYCTSGMSGDVSQPNKGIGDYWIVKTNGSGIKEWDLRFGGDGDDYLKSVKQTSDGGYILGGKSDSGISGDRTQDSRGSNDFWVVKTDHSGIKQWDARYGGDKNDGIHSLQQTFDGGYILGGSSSSDATGDKTQPKHGGADYWAVKIDGAGNKEWDLCYGGSGIDDEMKSIEQTADGGFLMGGKSDSGSSGDRTEPSKGLHDWWVVKLQPLISSCAVPAGINVSDISSSSAMVHWNVMPNANKYKVRSRESGTPAWNTVSASINSKKLTGLEPNTLYEFEVKSICKTAGLGNSDWSNPQTFSTSARLEASDAASFNVYPNPGTDLVNVSFFLSEEGLVKYWVSDFAGRKVSSPFIKNAAAGNQLLQIITSGLTAGIYFLHLQAGETSYIQKIIIQ